MGQCFTSNADPPNRKGYGRGCVHRGSGDARGALRGHGAGGLRSRPICGIGLDPGFPWGECTIVRADDIPGNNCVAHILADQPCLARETVSHWGEPVLLIAHPDRYWAEAARRHVRIRFEALEPVLDMEQAARVFQECRREKGDVNQAFRRADVTLEGVYRTPAVDQVYIETQGMLAVASREHGVTVRGSLQCPYYVHHALQHLFGLPGDKVRVVPCETGGGFGGKEDYPSMLACHAALLAWRSGRPVRMIYDRAEDLAATTKRHPSRARDLEAEDLVQMSQVLIYRRGAECAETSQRKTILVFSAFPLRSLRLWYARISLADLVN